MRCRCTCVSHATSFVYAAICPRCGATTFTRFTGPTSDRVIAYHRWREGTGDDVIVVASFAEARWIGYEVGFPARGFWKERFNSDAYDHWLNPQVAGNGGGVVAEGRALHGFATSAPIVIPANGAVVFVKG